MVNEKSLLIAISEVNAMSVVCKLSLNSTMNVVSAMSKVSVLKEEDVLSAVSETYARSVRIKKNERNKNISTQQMSKLVVRHTEWK